MAASKDLMDRLHEALATELLKAINEGVTELNKDGEVVRLSASASTMNVIRQFLKDNGIEADVSKNPTLQSLVSRLPFEGAGDNVHQFPSASQ